MGLFRTLVVAFILYYAWKLVSSLFLQSNNRHKSYVPPSSGSHNTAYNTPPKRETKHKEGDYIDYEEIE
jgi:hypothetical protein